MSFSRFKEEYFKLSEKTEQKKFIELRIKDLISKSSEENIGKGICGSYKGFISPNMELVSNSSGFFPNAVMDDMSIYEEFLNFIQNDIKYLKSEPNTIFYMQQFVWNYFGLNSGSFLERLEIYNNGSEPVSINKFKGNNTAACSERSAFVHNLLTFLGFDSEIVFGKFNETGEHAYIIFKPENCNFRILYDPMNPIRYEDEKIHYAMGVTSITEEQYESLKNGDSFEFDYSLIKKIFGSDKRYKESVRTYTCDDMLYEKNKIRK